jgi:uncharacterized protein YndB with AHSA1/START domain
MLKTGEDGMQVLETQITDSRVLNAPRELVFSMFTDAEHISNWWGPRGFTTKTERMDVRPGGLWIHTMISAEGVTYPNEVRYVEVDAPSRIVYDHISDPLFRATITFIDVGAGRTEVNFEMEFATQALRDDVAATYGAIEGLRDTLARFDEVVSTLGCEEFSITREFNAPRDLVYKAWTEPERLLSWFGPVDSELSIKKADMRSGGEMVYGMEAPDGSMIWGRWTFRDLTPPERIVLVMSFVDEQENAIPQPFIPDLPVEFLSTITFEERGGKTLMTLRRQTMHASDKGKVAYRNLFAGMEKGWTGTLDQLDAYLHRYSLLE